MSQNGNGRANKHEKMEKNRKVHCHICGNGMKAGALEHHLYIAHDVKPESAGVEATQVAMAAAN